MIELKNVSKYYHDGTQVTPGIQKINLTFRRGEFVAITGESGSGKTTLLNVVSGFDTYEDGEVLIDGVPTSGYDETDWEKYRREKVGFVFQNYNLVDNYTVLENVLSAIYICRSADENAEENAMGYLEKVGLTEVAKHRATELSAGQKQRLSIARALAKESPIIIADEPTGNLDEENGRQIVSLLKELSKDRLVIMVTHNYQEAAPFVTRKIVMHDCVVVSDEIVNEAGIPEEQPRIEMGRKIEGTFSKFLKMEFHSQKAKLSTLFFILLVTAGAMAIFFGGILENLDDTNAKKYDNSAFYNGSKTRIIVRHSDGSIITDKDMETLRAMNQVSYVDLYGAVNDMYYFYMEGEDYHKAYIASGENPLGLSGTKATEYNIILDRYDKFMKSSTCIKESELRAGALPKNVNEVVLCSDDDSVLGTQIEFFFQDARNMAQDGYVSMNMTVSGLLDGNSAQVYFSEDLCKSMGMILQKPVLKFDLDIPSDFRFRGEAMAPYIIIGAGLESGQIRLSNDYLKALAASYDTLFTEDGESLLDCCITSGVYDKKTDDYVNIQSLEHMTPVNEGNESMSKVVEISADDYHTLFCYYVDGSTQAGVYITDYAYVESVLSQIRAAGFEAVSPYISGSGEYDFEKVKERMTTLLMDTAGMMFVIILSILLIHAMSKLRKRDYATLKLIGMSQRELKQLQFGEVVIMGTAALLIAGTVFLYLGYRGMPGFSSMIKYFGWQEILFYCLWYMAVVLFSGYWSIRGMKKTLMVSVKG